jgi:hypothetical protein
MLKMDDQRARSRKIKLQEIEQFLLAAKGVRFEASQREEIYGWVERLLCQQEYARQGRRVRGLLRRYLGKMTCTITAQGSLFCDGSKSAVVPVKDGRRVALYAVEAPENWFEDFGSAGLVNGAVTIKLDSTFVQTVNLQMEYHVFLTPNGECKGLYVRQKGPASFEVGELGGGTSNVAFDYRIVAKRLGYESKRLVDMQPMLDKMESGRPKRRASALKQTAVGRE